MAIAVEGVVKTNALTQWFPTYEYEKNIAALFVLMPAHYLII